MRVRRRQFLRAAAGVAAGFYLMPKGWAGPKAPVVVRASNGDHISNTQTCIQMLGGISRYVGPTDVVVIKANGQWPNQGYTHTGCIKAVCDLILAIPSFSGEIIIVDNLQQNVSSQGWIAGQTGFDATSGYRVNNYAADNWNSLAAGYQAASKPVSTKQLICGAAWSGTPATPSFAQLTPGSSDGYSRYFFSYNGRNTWLGCPVFQSPLTSGRWIDPMNGVWESGSYTGRKVKVIFMPTLNNHGSGSEDYAGITSAIKSHFGITEIPVYQDNTWNSFYTIHANSFTQSSASDCGHLVGTYLNNLFKPVLYITCAIYTGYLSRTGTSDANFTNTVLACEDPVTLDFVSCRDVASPLSSWLNPANSNNTRAQITGCQGQGFGTYTAGQFNLCQFDCSAKNRLSLTGGNFQGAVVR